MKHIARLLAILIVVTMAAMTNMVGVQHKVLADSSTQLSTSSTKWLHVQGTRIVDGSGHQLFLRGAEIESAVKAALLEAFEDSQRTLRTDDIVRALSSIRPLAQVKPNEIEDLRRWAREALAVDANRGTQVGAADVRSLEL